MVSVADEASEQARDEEAVGRVLAEVVSNDVSALIPLDPTSGVGEFLGRGLIGELHWEQASIVQGAELRLALYSRLVFLPIGSPSGPEEEESDLRRFSVTGFVEHDPLRVTCDRPGDPCRILSLRDAEVGGEAVHDGELFTIHLNWVLFGSSEEPEIPATELLIGDQVIQDHNAAHGLETAGLVGRPFSLDVSDGDPLEFSVADGIVYGSGVFRLGSRLLSSG